MKIINIKGKLQIFLPKLQYKEGRILNQKTLETTSTTLIFDTLHTSTYHTGEYNFQPTPPEN